MRQSKRCSVSGSAPAAASTPRTRRKRRISSWNGSGRPAASRATTSPSRMSGAPGEIPPGDGHDVGEAARDVGHAPAPDRHPVAVAMELDARAVVLVLHRGGSAVRVQRLRRIGRDLGQHRQERHEDAGRGRREGLGAAGERERGHRGEVAGDERGPAHPRGRSAGRLRYRLQRQSVREAHAHLAEDDALEEVALLLGGARGQLAEARLAQAPRARARRFRDRRRRPPPRRRG